MLTPPTRGCAAGHGIWFCRWLPPLRGSDGLPAGSQAHSARLLTLYARKVGTFSFRSRGTAPHQTDHVLQALGLLKVQSAGGSLHLCLKSIDRIAHTSGTHDRGAGHQWATRCRSIGFSRQKAYTPEHPFGLAIDRPWDFAAVRTWHAERQLSSKADFQRSPGCHRGTTETGP